MTVTANVIRNVPPEHSNLGKPPFREVEGAQPVREAEDADTDEAPPT
jgi:hypothetical protein